MIARYTLYLALFSTLALAQADPPAQPAKHAVRPSVPSLSQDEIRQLIRKAAANDMENDTKLRNYTCFEVKKEIPVYMI
jgi:hypothetical protein